MAASGAPLAGIEVVAFLRVEPAGYEERLREIEAIQSYAGRGSAQARTGEDGRYELSHLPDGQYTVVGRAQGYVAAEAAGVKPGEQAPDLMLSRLGALRVKVTAAATALPVTSYGLEIERERLEGGRRSPLEEYIPRQEVTDPDGMYVREGMSPGSYWITVRASRFAMVTTKRQVLEGQDNLVELRLQPGALVEALVLDEETGSPLAGAAVYCRRIAEEVEPASGTRYGSESRETGGDGLASFDMLSEGRFSISAWHSSYFAVQSESLVVEIPRDGGSRFEFKMRPGGGINGNFTNMKSSGSPSVVHQLVLRRVEAEEVAKDSAGTRKGDANAGSAQSTPAPGSLPRERSTTVNPESGGFELGGVPPGTYTLFLRKRVLIRREDGAVLKVQEDDAPVQVGTVEIRPGETQTLKLEAP
jgi:hypothetical protein